jgi:hypothetical protein
MMKHDTTKNLPSTNKGENEPKMSRQKGKARSSTRVNNQNDCLGSEKVKHCQ